MATTPQLASSLVDKGYTGATGNTPYKPATPEQTATLQSIYNDKSVTTVPRTVSANAISLNVNFDGTHNNGLYPAAGESPTNIFQLSELQAAASGGNPDNTMYHSGVGAQTMPSNALHPVTGNPMPEASPSNWQALPMNAGAAATVILEKAYEQLRERVLTTLSDNPNAEIAINLAGFSRGGAEATAFANMLNERGIGPFKAGEVRIANLLLLDPVDQTSGTLNVTPPTNVDNTLVMVATGEARSIMPAMVVSEDARVIALPVAHSGLGGSYNPQGTAAVVLQKAREFMDAGGSPVADIPENLRPDWSQMFIHNSSITPNGVPKLGGSQTWETDEPDRRYEGTNRDAPSVQETVAKLPTYSTIPTDDQGTAAYIATYPDGKVITKLTEDGKLTEVHMTQPNGVGSVTKVYDPKGALKSQSLINTDDDGNTLVTTTWADGTITTRLTQASPPETSDFQDALLDAFTNADQSAADIKAKYPGTLVADGSGALSDAIAQDNNSFSNYLNTQGTSLTPAQQTALAAQVNSLGLGGEADLSFYSLPGGGALIANADGDIVGEINRSDAGDLNLRATAIDADGNTVEVSQHITEQGQSLTDAQYSQQQLAQLSTQLSAGLGLVNNFQSLQNWGDLNDLSRLSTLVGTYNNLSNLTSGASGFLGDLGPLAGGLGLIAALDLGDGLGIVSSVNVLTDSAVDGAINSALGSSGIPYLSIITSLANFEDNPAQSIGSLVGMCFGGPIGAAIGGFIGGNPFLKNMCISANDALYKSAA